MSVTVSSGNSSWYIMAGEVDDADFAIDGGSTVVDAGGTADATSVASGGSLAIDAGGGASGSIVSSGGDAFVYGTASGTQVGAGGVEQVLSGGVDDGTTIAGGTEVVSSGGIVNGTVTFAGSGGELVVEDLASIGPKLALAGFNSPQDQLDLATKRHARSSYHRLGTSSTIEARGVLLPLSTGTPLFSGSPSALPSPLASH
jgi:autotransporter passenger strand-loop-strand repeat protein